MENTKNGEKSTEIEQIYVNKGTKWNFLDLLFLSQIGLIKGTQEWEFFWLRFWILYYFNVSYA
jgi:hypothetical protein